MRSGATCCRDGGMRCFRSWRCAYLPGVEDLHEHVTLEMRTRGTDTARAILSIARHASGEVGSKSSVWTVGTLCECERFPAEDATAGPTKEKRREKLAEALLREVRSYHRPDFCSHRSGAQMAEEHGIVVARSGV